MTAGRAGGLAALVVLVFGVAYLLTSSSGSAKTSAPSTVRKLTFPAPAVAVPAADPGTIPALVRPPRPVRPVAPTPQAPPPAPPPPPAGGGGGGGGGGGCGGGGGGIIQG
jgi:hypothetical protein